MSPTLRELESVCQKPRWREVGSLLARRGARPAALYLTWLVVRWPVSANAVTALALVVGCVAAFLFAQPQPAAFVAGVVALHVWYLLDHVDGQVARYRRTESVTGLYFDFMMHHVVHPACAFALGYGVACRTGELTWTLAGAGFAIGLMLLAVSNDCRYKAYFALSRRGFGQRSVIERGVGWTESSRLSAFVEEPMAGLADSAHPTPAAPTSLGEADQQSPSRVVMIASHMVRWSVTAGQKLCEMPNVILALTALAAVTVVDSGTGHRAVQIFVLGMSLLAPSLGIGRLVKHVLLGLPDREFRALEERRRERAQ
jgi:phosphatidylglycerophosphate synthase